MPLSRWKTSVGRNWLDQLQNLLLISYEWMNQKWSYGGGAFNASVPLYFISKNIHNKYPTRTETVNDTKNYNPMKCWKYTVINLSSFNSEINSSML